MTTVNNIVGAICIRSDWTLSNLSIQKAAFLCQMFYVGQTGVALFNDDFEAWDYGPVQPRLYHNLKMFGRNPVKPMSYLQNHTLPDELAVGIVNDITDFAVKSTAGWLVDITHWENGAWAKHYKPGEKGIVIPKSDIQAEYADRYRLQNPQAPNAA